MRTEIIVDSFAGGGGASKGMKKATGRPVNIAINHDPAAIALYKVNHPETEVYCENIWEVDPVKACKGKPVALAWFSPDCTHHSKARGGKPKDKNIRGLAWIVLKWAAKVKPRVIMLENVEEFQGWGPLRKGKVIKSRTGETFEKWKSQLVSLGYKVEHRELRACDYGAPTIRKRFFLIARRDGKPIIWPEPTHGDPNGIEARTGILKPWRTAAEIIDWSLPCPSIFERKRPLAENTMRRIARGIQKFVIENPKPFIVQVNHGGRDFRGQDIREPLPTITAKHGYGLVAPVISQIGHTGGGNRLHDIQEPLSTIVSKNEHMLVTPFLASYHSEKTKDEVRGSTVDKPMHTLDTSNRFALVSAFISKYYAGNYKGAGSDLNEPTHTVTSKDHNALVTAFITKFYKTGIGQDLKEPLHTVTTSPGHFGEVRAFLLKYYGADVGQDCNDPLHTVTSKDRFGLVTIQGEDYQIVDIGMRMLTPRELFNAQGFPEDYIIDKDYEGNKYPGYLQVAMCGNSVPPPFSEALTRANLPELCIGEDENIESTAN